MVDIVKWIEEKYPLHSRVTSSVVAILESLLNDRSIDYLSVSGRTKDKKSIEEKIKRKNYGDLDSQLTDFSGIRVIVFIESDVERVCKIIESAFDIDVNNSVNPDDHLGASEVGYRSVHFVATLGKDRGVLQEFSAISELKFEVQVRTVLQHAWAEMAHDRSYKFRDKLPNRIQRKLNLYAGLLELADKGFSEVSAEVDEYGRELDRKYSEGSLGVDINSISLQKYVREWAKKNDYPLEEMSRNEFDEIISEMKEFGLKRIEDIENIIPINYSSLSKKYNLSLNIYGLVRDWMLIKDPEKLINEMRIDWKIFDPTDNEHAEREHEFFKEILPKAEYDLIAQHDERI